MRDDLGFIGEVVVWLLLIGCVLFSLGAAVGLAVLGFQLTRGIG